MTRPFERPTSSGRRISPGQVTAEPYSIQGVRSINSRADGSSAQQGGAVAWR